MGILFKYIIMAVQPAKHKKIVKKITHTPKRFQSHQWKRVNPNSHRKVRGIDCFTRRRFKGTQKMPKIGSKQDARTRHLLPNGFKKFLINNEKDLELLLMNNRTYCGEISQRIGVSKRLRIVQRAKELNVRLTNAKAKAKKESTEWAINTERTVVLFTIKL